MEINEDIFVAFARCSILGNGVGKVKVVAAAVAQDVGSSNLGLFIEKLLQVYCV